MKAIALVLLIFLFNIHSAFALNYYWVGGSGNWNDLTHWVTTSGGATNHVSLPTQSDDVFFDANSFSATGQTVSFGADINCKNMDWTGVTNNPVFASTSNNIHINIYGSLTLVSGMTLTDPFGSTQWWLQGNGLGKTVTTAGKSFYAMYFSGDGGEWTLQDDLTTSFTVYLDRGTLNTNDKTITTGTFSSYTGCGGCNIRTLNLGSSIINCSSQWVIYTTGLTLNAGTSTIRTAWLSSAGQAYYNVEMNGSSTNFVTSSAESFNNLDFTNGTRLEFTSLGNITISNRFGLNRPGSTIALRSGATITVNGTIELPNPAGCAATTYLQSTLAGSAANLVKSSGAVTGGRLALSDIAASGGAVFTANNSVDLGGNSGWTINAATATTYYWVGGTGNFNDGAHWSLSSGGSASGCSPSLLDNVRFDANSFSAPGQTVSFGADINCKNMDWTGVTNNPVFASTSNNTYINIYGSLTLVSGMTLTDPFGSTQWWLQGNGLGKTITTAGKSFYAMYFSGDGGEWTLQDDLTTSFMVYLDRGTLNTNDKTITTGTFSSYTGCGGCNIRTLNLGSSIINCSTQWIIYTTGLTLNAGTSTIRTAWLSSAGQAYYNVEMNGSSTNFVTSSAESFNNLDFTNGTRLEFTSTGNITISNRFGLNRPGSTIALRSGATITVNGTIELPNPAGCAATTYLQSTLAGSAANLVKSSGAVTGGRLALSDIAASGGAVFTANNSVDLGGNSGWTINAATATTYYWVGGTGNFNDGAHWSLSSGGSASGCSPSLLDNVRFDANSFSAPGQTVSFGADINCKNMDWTGVTNNPVFASTSNNIYINIYGSLTLVSGMTLTDPFGSTQWWLQGNGLGKTVTTAGKSFYAMFFSGDGGEWTLQDDLTTSFMVYLDRGTLNTNDKTITTGTFSSYTGCGGCNIRTLNLGSSIINCSTQWIIYTTGLTLNAGTSSITAPWFVSGGQTYNDVAINGSVGFPTLNTSSDIFNNLTINTTVNTNFTGSGPLTINNDLIINGPAKIITINPAVQINLGNSFIINSSVTTIITIQSTSNGVQATFNKSSGIVCINYVALKDINATGGASFYASLSTDDGNNTGWSFTTQSCDEVLPVLLSRFETLCRDNGILFKWATASEHNTSHFNIEVQKGNSWEVIGRLNATGESVTERNYEFFAINQTKGNYRLVMIDKDGSFKYSPIRIARCEVLGSISIIPNPAYHNTTLTIERNSPARVVIKLINASGQLIQLQQKNLVQGTNQVTIDLTKLPAGLYVIQVSSDEMNENRSLIKLK